MQLSIVPINRSVADEICSWRYEPPYELYNLEHPPDEETLRYILDPAFAYHAIFNSEGQTVGFCSFGEDGQVPGGDYSANALDIGMGMRPDLTGRGLGVRFAIAVVEFAGQQYATQTLRVTIAQFNQRAQRVWQKVGFSEIERFGRVNDNMPFVILTLAP